MAYDTEKLKTISRSSGVYLMKDASDKILYIGKAKNLRSRVSQYFAEGRDSREMIPFLISKVHAIETIVTPDEKEALLLENSLIKKHQPKYNILLKDDKTFISLMVNIQHPWPKIQLIRYKKKPNEKGLFFGPYISAIAARETYEILNDIFPLRQCSDSELIRRKRPCLLYSIKKCIAPCVNKCTKEDYDSYVKEAIEFLKGQDRSIIRSLKKDMQIASDNLQYEKAAALLRALKRIEHISKYGKNITHTFVEDLDAFGIFRQTNHVMIVKFHYRDGRLIGSEHHSILKTASNNGEVLTSILLQLYSHTTPPKLVLLPEKIKDIHLLEEIFQEQFQQKVSISFPSRGEKKKIIELANENAREFFEQELKDQFSKEALLLELQETLNLNNCPLKIECFDTSNISMTDAVASLSAFTNGEKDTSRYRLFKINKKDHSDDYSAMREVLTRRLSRAKEDNDFPDLIILDGGRGQLNVGIQVLKELDIASVDIIALTKENAKHDKGLTRERVFIPDQKEPIVIERTSSLLFFLQNIRDEAHRRAINYHRKRRQKRTIQSSLDKIPGIGPKKKKILFQVLGSIANIKQASLEELEKIKGISKKDAQMIKEYFTSEQS